MNDAISIARATSAEDLAACMEVRRKVFIEGQNVPEDREIDGLDPESSHYLLQVDGRATGAARVRFTKDKAKIERVAI
ncbi:MAG: N-acetyltransferase, partial [Pseudomonadota bacterium]